MSELTYIRFKDYRYPIVALSEPPMELAEPVGKYGMMRKSFLKTHRPISYNSLLLGEKLYPHLRETEATATSRVAAAMAELLLRNPPPDKATDQLAWARHMNGLRATAEEAILREVVYS